MMKLMSILGMTVIAVSHIGAAELHVSPNGDDANPGTKVKPLQTIAAARDLIRGCGSGCGMQDAGAASTVYLAKGNYFLAEAIRFDERDSHTTYRSYGAHGKGGSLDVAAMPTIYGGKPITGWQKWKGEIWRAKAPTDKPFRRLFVDGTSAVLARHPNLGTGYGGGMSKINNTTIGIPETWKDYNFTHAQLFGWVGANWFSEMRGVRAVDREKLQLTVFRGSGQFNGLNSRIYIQGVPELLDEPGEWALNAADGFVHYWPENGADPNEALVVAATTERVLDIRGSSMDKPIEGLSIEGLRLVGSNFSDDWWLFDRKKVLASDMPEPLQEGLIYAENAKEISIRDCKIVGAGHSGVYLNHWAQNCEVQGCWIEDAGFAGIYMNGWAPGRGPFKSAAESYVNKNHKIINNYIYDCGKFIGAGCGIQFHQSGDNDISHNRIARMPRYGISYKGIRFGKLGSEHYGTTVSFTNHWDFLHTRNNRLAYNDISNVCLDSFDFGGIESWGVGRDNVWEYNSIHDIAQSVKWNGWAHGLFPDDACHYHTLRGNVVYALHGGKLTGAFMVKSCNQIVENNIVAACPIGRIFTMSPFWEAAVDMRVRRNIVDGLTHALHSYGNRSFKQSHRVKDPTGAMDVFLKDKPVYKEVDHQIVWPKPAKLETYQGFDWEKNAIVADPMFVRRPPFWKLHHTDFALKPESPALKAGFKPIDLDRIGLLEDFGFDRKTLMRIPADSKIQAEDATRVFNARPKGGTDVAPAVGEAWIMFGNVDFGDGSLVRADIAVSVASDKKNTTNFMRRYGDTVVNAVPMAGRKDAEPISVWEVSPVYKIQGKAGDELRNIEFAPEQDGSKVEWKPFTEATTDRAGKTSAPGVVDLNVFHGEEIVDGCAYMRASIHTDCGRTNANLRLWSETGAKVWLNGELILDGIQKPDDRLLVVLNKGWNTFLVKVIQGTSEDRPFHAKLGVTNSECGQVVALPGLPTTETTTGSEDSMVELRLDAPDGDCIGVVPEGERLIDVKPVTGSHDLFVVFKQACRLDYLQFKTKK